MIKEVCIPNCKFSEKGVCKLYGVGIKQTTIPDPYDKGNLQTFLKCDECMEKELSCSIDDKVRDLHTFHQAYTHEMDMLFDELGKLVDRRKEIYTEEK
jgi:hypothetical protein